ncbi:MAG: hypothetical protein G01um101420_615 [Parcubacteria group bacterium Gr01-1014_20]|nr:MAG: hypothetical protein G01um101420_615 [Parcubacteria group bacterium Gr01-1014_20]
MIKLPFIDYSREKFLLLEVYPRATRGLLISIDQGKKIKLEKIWSNFSWSNLSRHFRQKITKWNVIVSASPVLAVTTVIPIRLEREKNSHASPIQAGELENLLAQATAKIFNQCRAFASRSLGIDELDTILIDNRVIGFKIDNHQVVNPIDFKAKHIDAIFELTLTTRKIFDDWKNFFNIGETRNFFFTELSRAEISVLEKIKRTPFSLVVIEKDGTTAFHIDRSSKNSIVRRFKINWLADKMISEISKAWGVDESIAREIYSNYLKKDVSPHVFRYLSRLTSPVIESLYKELKKANLKGQVFMDTHLPIPTVFPKRLRGMTIVDLPVMPVLDKLGFKADFRDWPIGAHEISRRLAPFFEFYYNNDKESSINHWLRRRLHWLGSSS